MRVIKRLFGWLFDGGVVEQNKVDLAFIERIERRIEPLYVTKELQWEEIPNKHYSGAVLRARIFGGWLVRYVEEVATTPYGGDTVFGIEWSSSITFVPDPEGVWKIG